jgi:hypothetical protein
MESEKIHHSRLPDVAAMRIASTSASSSALCEFIMAHMLWSITKAEFGTPAGAENTAPAARAAVALSPSPLGGV